MTRDQDIPDWIDRCTPRTGFLLLCLGATFVVAMLVAACRAFA